MVLAPLSLVTVAARVRGRRIANLSTRIVSIALAIVFPIGTALFVYWLLRVREEEARRARDE